MSTTSKPRHGDAIVEVSKDKFGNDIGVPTRQFQTFLDELGVTAQALSDLLDSIGASNTFAVEARIAQLQKDIADIKHPNLLPMIQRLLKEEIPQRRAPSLSLVDKRLTELESRHPRSLLSAINQLTKITDEQAQLIGSLRSQNGRQSAIINNLLKGIPLVQVETDVEYDQTKFDDVIYGDATSANFDLNFIDPALAFKPFTAMNCTGIASTITCTAAVGTIVGTATLTDGQSRTFYPRKSTQEWRQG